MADRRQHKRAPAKSRVTVRNDGGRTPRTHRSWGSILRGLAWLFGPPLASAGLLTLAFPPAEVSWLAYVALVPLMVTAVRARTGRDAFVAALAGGIVFFGINLYWIVPITTAGYLAVLPYLGLYWAVWALAMRWLSRRQAVPLAVAAPVVWVALEWIRGWALSGLPWLFVGHTQYENLVLIQTADVVGAYGPSALCLATTGLVAAVLVRPLFVPRGVAEFDEEGAEGLRPPRADSPAGQAGRATPNDGAAGREPRRAEAAGKPRVSGMLLANLLVVAVASAVTVGYGLHRLAEAPQGGGPVVASVQTNVPQEIKLKARLEQVQRLEEQMMQAQLDLTDQALARAAERGRTVDLVCWPETMVPGILNREYLEADIDRVIEQEGLRRVFRYLQNRSRGYWLAIHEKARQADVPILFGAHAVDLEGVYRLPGGGYFTRGPRQNTAFLLTPDARPYKADHRYAKAHLVPFGEYVPLKESWPWLHGVLQAFTPYEYDHSLTPGAHDQAPFAIRYGKKGEDGGGEATRGGGREVRFQVAICYEDAMAYRIREMVRAGAPPRGGDPSARLAGDRRSPPNAIEGETATAGDVPSPAGRAEDGEAGTETRRASAGFLKAADFIVNISNDGWFAGTWELDQHLNLCVFRAVENRVPVVRSVNTGISAIIQSTGRITRVVERDGRRRGVRGCIVGEATLDDRIAPYTVHGDAFAYGCLLATAGLAAAVIVGRLHDRGGQKQ
ncbi:MAG: nitrilase-related carbon-nitrogen hydrolase [Phycisphaerae bacterium]